MPNMNQNLGNVRVELPSKEKHKHDLSHHVETSSSFTDVVPMDCVLCDPGDKHVINHEQMIYLAPVLSPTFGKMNWKNWYYFVRMSDLSENFAALMSETEIKRGDRFFYPQKVPHAPLAVLSLWPLLGAHCTIYYHNHSDTSNNWVLDGSNINSWTSAASTDAGRIRKWLYDNKFIRFQSDRRFDGCDACCLNARLLVNPSVFTYPDGVGAVTPNAVVETAPSGSLVNESYDTYIPLNNVFPKHFFDSRGTGNVEEYNFRGLNESPCSLSKGGYDYIVDYDDVVVGDYTYDLKFVFRCSDFGKRLKRSLEGLGYRLNLSAKSQEVSLMPIFATWLAYWGSFGILRNQNLQQTYMKQILELYDTYNITNFSMCLHHLYNPNTVDDPQDHALNLMSAFIQEFGRMWTTDSVNLISAHIRNSNVIVPSNSIFRNILDINRQNNQIYLRDRVNVGTNGSAASYRDETNFDQTEGFDGRSFIQTLSHGALDEEVLFKLYRLTNVNTIAGKNVRQLLRAAGYGSIISDEKDASFITETSVPLVINAVLSRADTFVNVDEGSQLGERGGNGEGHGMHKGITYTAPEIGFFVCMGAVVPEGDYCQQLDPHVTCVSKYDFYNREFDGLGFEMSPKSFVCGDLSYVTQHDKDNDPLNDSFGLVPTYTRLKFLPSKICGDFSLSSRKEYALQYCMDRVIELNDTSTKQISFTDGGANPGNRRTVYDVQPAFMASELPIAGDLWRYTARYEWLNHFYRIFSSKGDDIRQFEMWGDYLQSFEFLSRTYDNFLIMNDFNWSCWSDKLQLADSYETTDDGNDGETNSNMTMQ